MDKKHDDRALKDILSRIDVPETDENARKTATNLALAAYDDAMSKKNKKFSQGLPLWTRLTGSSHDQPRRPSMNKRFIYGGTATALGLILAVGLVFTIQSPSDLFDHKTVGTSLATLDETAIAPTANITANVTADSAREAEATADIVTAYNTTAQSPLPAPAEAPAVTSGGAMMAESAITLQHAAPQLYAGNAGAPASARGMAKMQAMPQAMPYAADIVSYPVMPAESGRDQFTNFEESAIKAVRQAPVSTFSIDVDTASYAFTRRQLNHGVLPQKDAVRVEELVNYFDYNYATPADKTQPFQPTVTIVPSPWKDGNKLVHIGIKGYDIAKTEQPDSHLVFLLDTSGSMHSADKLPLVVQSLKLMLDTLKPTDKIAIVTYAGSAGTALEPTAVSDKGKIVAALDGLAARGSTAGAEGIRQAYTLAESMFAADAVNRVILATDGDFNVGIQNPEELKDFVERKRESGIYLSVLGFGQGNLNDTMMQTLAQNGNGVAAYIDTLNEARKVLGEEAHASLFPIANDVKIQVEFNPETVAEYRLVGYETRALKQEDFNNDKVDAGDIGAGHTVTAIYEITPVGGQTAVDAPRYTARSEDESVTNDAAAKSAPATPESTTADPHFADEYAFLKIRYKLPGADTSQLITTPITTQAEAPWDAAGIDQRFSIAVAGFAQLLKGGVYIGPLTYDDVIAQAQAAKGDDPYGYRAEFINLVRLAKSADALQKQP